MVFDYRREYHRYKQYYGNLRRFYEKPVIKVSFFVLLSFMTVVFFSLVAIKPTVTTISKLIREIEDKKKINESLDKKAAALNELQNQIALIENDLPLVFNALPENALLDKLMQQLEFVAQAEGVQLLSVNFEPIKLGGATSAKNEADKINFSLSAGGGFKNLVAFLSTLEDLGRIMVFTDLTFSSGSLSYRQQGSGTIIDVKGSAYYLYLMNN